MTNNAALVVHYLKGPWMFHAANTICGRHAEDVAFTATLDKVTCRKCREALAREAVSPRVESVAIAAVMTCIAGLLGAFMWLGAAGFFDPIPQHPQPCPAVWRADCDAATR